MSKFDQKKSKRKCPKWPIVNCHALCYIGGLSVNLNHLKTNEENSLERRIYEILNASNFDDIG